MKPQCDPETSRMSRVVEEGRTFWRFRCLDCGSTERFTDFDDLKHHNTVHYLLHWSTKSGGPACETLPEAERREPAADDVLCRDCSRALLR